MALRLLLWSLSVWTFPFVDHPDSISVNLSLSRSPWGVHVHRDEGKETTQFWPATILTSVFEKKPTVSCFQTISSFLYGSQVSPRPSGIESTLFAHLACWQSVFLFFSPVGSVCLGVAEAAVWGFSSAGPGGEGRAMTLLVTSDTAQPLPVRQMEGKCKWGTAGWEREQATDQP